MGEQNPFLRVAPIDENVEAFDPLHRGRGAADFAIPDRIKEIYYRGQLGIQGMGAGLRRTIKWRFEAVELRKPLVPQMMNKIKYSVQTRHKINLRYAYWLRNIETDEYMVYYTNTNSPWFVKLSQTKEWPKKTGIASPSR